MYRRSVRQVWHERVGHHFVLSPWRTSYIDNKGEYRTSMPWFNCGCGYGWGPYAAAAWSPTRKDTWEPY